jgi:hypothetical protein
MCGMDGIVRTVMAGCDDGREALLDGLLVLLALRACVPVCLVAATKLLPCARLAPRPPSASLCPLGLTRRTHARTHAHPALAMASAKARQRQD